MNYKKVIIYLTILIHIIGLAFFAYYSFSTKCVCNLIITSSGKTEIIASTPLGKDLTFTVSENESIELPLRPWKSIVVKTDNDTYNLLSKINENNYNSKYGTVSYKITERIDNKYFGVLKFIVELHNWLLIIYLLGITIVTIMLFILKNNRVKSVKQIKYTIFRYLLRIKSPLRKNENQLVFSKTQTIWMIILGVFMLCSLFMNLGKYPFGQDSEEKRRALVSLEMKISENYIVPTTNGENYYNKPPLFNWLITPVIQSKNVEYNTRAVSVSILIILGVSIFLLLKKSRGVKQAYMISLLTIGSWHVLSYLSFLINVDALFALFLVPLFYLNYKFANEEKPLKLFITNYILFSLAFLTKGIPAIWFMIISIFSALLINKKLRLIFTWQHLTGIACSVVILGLYILIYSQFSNPAPYLMQLINETQISGQYTLLEKINHILIFPALNIKSYRPVLILLPLIFFRENITRIIKDKESGYLIIIVLSGSLIFLTSPYYLPYYVLMFIPLLSDLIVRFLNSFSYSNLKMSLRLPAILTAVYIPYALSSTQNLSWDIFIIIFLGFVFSIFRKQIIYLILGVLSLTILFKAFGDMGYYNDSYNFNTPTKEDCCRIARNYKSDIEIIKNDDLINYVSVFYLTYYRKEVIPLTDSTSDKDKLFLTTTPEIYIDYQILDSIRQYVWTYNDQKKSKGESIYKPLYLISKDPATKTN